MSLKVSSKPTKTGKMDSKSKSKPEVKKATKTHKQSSESGKTPPSGQPVTSKTFEEDQIALGSSEDSSSDDSSDSEAEDDGADTPAIEVARLPTIAKDDESIARKLKAIKAKSKAVCVKFHIS
jgi:nucleolar protein 15